MSRKKHIEKKKNILYTGYGDKGTTTLYDCKQGRISKSAILIEALGSVDELNAYLGVVKVLAETEKISIKLTKKNIPYSQIIEDIQQTLFVIQAEIAGSKMAVSKKELNKIENIIAKVSEILPPIKNFTISGGSLLSASLDYARTLARKTERRIISVVDAGDKEINKNTLAYLNRLSSVLFALSRYVNYFFSIKENHPKYNKK